jgi:O-antigen/teichoic acid export membrane protein
LKALKRDILFETGHLSVDLARKTVRGGMTTLVAQVVNFIISSSGLVILARLLTPYDYGLIGMVMVVVNFAVMFKDAGLSMATVQKENISHDQISSLFWCNLAVSAFLWLCVLCAAPLVARFYGRPELVPVTAALSTMLLIGGVAIQHLALLQRHMRFGSMAVIQIASQAITVLVSILFALMGWRYWALVCGTLAGAVADMLFTLLFCQWMPSLPKRGAGVRGMLAFGGYVTGFNFVNYFSRNADYMLIGKYIGAVPLGLYTKAYELFMLPITQIRSPLNRVAMPVLSSLRNQPAQYVRYYQRIIDLMAMLAMPLTMLCAVEADFIIRLMLGEKWMGAVPVFRILAFVGLIQAIASTRGLVLLSNGLAGRYFYWGLINSIVVVAGFVVGVRFGIKGVATSYAVTNYAILIPSLYYCFHNTPVTVKVFLKTLVPPLLSSLTAGACVLIARHLWRADSLFAHSCYLALFLVVYMSLCWLRPETRHTFMIVIKSVFKPTAENAGEA